jgi:hypothetical protein
MTILLSLFMSGCATSGSGAPSAKPCVEQDRCLLFCIIRQNRCEYAEEKPDGAEQL